MCFDLIKSSDNWVFLPIEVYFIFKRIKGPCYLIFSKLNKKKGKNADKGEI